MYLSELSSSQLSRFYSFTLLKRFRVQPALFLSRSRVLMRCSSVRRSAFICCVCARFQSQSSRWLVHTPYAIWQAARDTGLFVDNKWITRLDSSKPFPALRRMLPNLKGWYHHLVSVDPGHGLLCTTSRCPEGEMCANQTSLMLLLIVLSSSF